MNNGFKNVIGEVYNSFTIIGHEPRKKTPHGGKKMVRVKCVCGTEKIHEYKTLTRGKIKSCGCFTKIKLKEGDKVGFLTILKRSENIFECICDCGTEVKYQATLLNTGRKKNCPGCPLVQKKIELKPLDLEKLNHRKIGDWKVTAELPMENSRRKIEMECKCGYKKECYLKNINKSQRCAKCADKEIKARPKKENHELINNLQRRFRDIKKRCYDTNDKDYKNYGARGIRICQEWLDNSKAFIEWSINNGFQIGLQIDRINNDGNYEPSNCRYVTSKENNRNMRTNVMNYQYVENIRYGEWKNYSVKRIASIIGCSEYAVKCVRNFKTWV